MAETTKTKDEIIVFQNQSHLVQKYFNDCGICPDLLDIALATDIMVKFAVNGFNKDLKIRFDNFQKYCDEKYKGDLSDIEVKEDRIEFYG
jgi:hypothetical protein